MECSRTWEGGTLVIRIQGRLDASTTDAFDQQWQSWLEPRVVKVMLDLSDLEFITSAGLRSVLALNKKLKARRGQLSLCGLNGVVSEVFAVSGISFLLPVFKSLDEALVAP